MDVIQIWRTPHHFHDLETDAEHFTYGAASVELATQEPGDEPALGRWGIEWSASLWAQLRGERAPTGLERELAKHHLGPHERGFTKPGDLGPLIADHAARTWPTIKEWVDAELAGLAAPLLAAADAGTRPPLLDHAGAEAVDRFLDVYASHTATEETPDGFKYRTTHRYQLRRLNDNRWFVRPDDLLARIALELADLLTSRPVMRRCRLCNRPFAQRPGKRAAICAAQVWTWPGSKLVSYCDPETARVELARIEEIGDPEAERTRQRKTLHARVVRARQKTAQALAAAAGNQDDETYQRLLRFQELREEEANAFKLEHGRTAGRRPRDFDIFEPDEIGAGFAA